MWWKSVSVFLVFSLLSFCSVPALGKSDLCRYTGISAYKEHSWLNSHPVLLCTNKWSQYGNLLEISFWCLSFRSMEKSQLSCEKGSLSRTGLRLPAQVCSNWACQCCTGQMNSSLFPFVWSHLEPWKCFCLKEGKGMEGYQSKVWKAVNLNEYIAISKHSQHCRELWKKLKIRMQEIYWK